MEDKHEHEHCDCGCEHEHNHEHEHCKHKQGNLNCERRTYIVENMDCANCAAKLESKINALNSVEMATLTYATKQLKVYSENPEQALQDVRACIASNEPEWELVIPERKKSSADADEDEEESKYEPLIIGIGLVVLAAVILLSNFYDGAYANILTLIICIAGYLFIGGHVLINSFKNIMRGEIFDENFLMSIATIGAFIVGEYPEALGVMVFYRIGEYFEDKAVDQSRKHISEALDLRPETVTLFENGIERVIPAEEAVEGDIIIVRPGDRIPLDSTVTDGSSMLDTSAVTGEPVPISVHAGDKAISGCVNTTGLLTLKVENTLEESMVSRILESVENAAASKPKIDRFITRFAKVYTPIVVAIAVLAAVVPSVLNPDSWYYWVKTACTFLVISCPCALVLSVPLAFFAGIGVASKEHILFKGGSAMEMLADVKAIVMDKTGTITEGNFKVQVIEPISVSEDELLKIAGRCEMHSTHPIAVSILNAAKERNIAITTCENVQEVAGKGIQADEYLCGNRKLLEENGVKLPKLDSFEGSTAIYIADSGEFIGRILISDTIKSDANSSLAQIKSMGLKSVMLTGDNEESAKAVSKAVGIDEVRAKLLPQDKLSAISEIRKKYGGVFFIGDGINDAPVLAGADVGAAMGSGADAAIEAADLVFMTNEMNAIPKSIKIAKKATTISKENVVFALTVKAFVMILGLIGFANMWLAVFADTGVAMICIINSTRLLYQKVK